MDSLRRALIAGASLAASAMLARAFVKNGFISSRVDALRARFSSEITITIKEEDGYSDNHVFGFGVAIAYLATKIPPSARCLRVSKQHDAQSLAVALPSGEATVDVFEGVEFRWALVRREIQRADGYPTTVEARSLVLTFDKKHKEKALSSYLPYVFERLKAIKDQDRTLKLHMNVDDHWLSVDLHHPATFGTLAMDAGFKQLIMDDLDTFVEGKEHYKRTGKAWRHACLLHGLSGTGKTSFVAAMANHLRFDIYELDLSSVRHYSSLCRLLATLPSRSMLVIEDIDSVIDWTSAAPQDQDDKITAWGFLSLVGGVWSSCNEAQILVFTTKCKKPFLPACLAQAGLMDNHLFMACCRTGAFRQLALNYHSLVEHPLFNEIEELVGNVKITITPAEVAEQLITSTDAGVALQRLLDLLKRKEQQPETMPEGYFWH